MINKVNTSPSFTSRVVIANISMANESQMQVLQSPKTLRALERLTNNGDKNSIVITPDTDSGIAFNMSVTEKVGKKFQVENGIVYNDEDFEKLYKLSKDTITAFGPEAEVKVVGKLADYIV